MLENLNEHITVLLKSADEIKTTGPVTIFWRGRVYKVEKIGLHYTYKAGAKLFHVYCVSSADTNFKLVLDTNSLLWTVQEVYDKFSG